jgi:competence protein ComEC
MQRIKNNFKYLFLLALFSATGLVWYAVFAESRSGLTVAFFDVGQGDSIFIETSTGQQILIDGGPNKKVLEGLSKVMPFYDRLIDVVVATHPDGDHIGGLPEVLKRYSVDLVLEPGVESDTAVSKTFENLIEEKGIKKILGRRGMKLVLSDNAYLLILFPIGDVSEWNTNDASIVAKLVYGKTSYLFTGDSPQKIENYLISADKENLDVDVLKVGHHGSKTSSSELFIGYTSPEYAVISAGKDNRYGHPHKEVLDILEKFGVEILRTDELGIIKIKSDGENIAVVD